MYPCTFRIGRKTTMYVGLLLLIAAAFGVSWAPEIISFTILEFIIGGTNHGSFLCTNVLGKTKYRNDVHGRNLQSLSEGTWGLKSLKTKPFFKKRLRGSILPCMQIYCKRLKVRNSRGGGGGGGAPPPPKKKTKKILKKIFEILFF